MADSTKPPRSGSAGVDQLISRLRQEGVVAGEKAAAEIVAEAESRARTIVGDAKKKAEDIVEEARDEAARTKEAGEQALRLAGRDTMLRLERRLMNNFTTLTRGLISAEMADREFLRDLIREVTRRAREESGLEQVDRIEILLPDSEGVVGDTDAAETKLGELARQIMAESWREGVTFARLKPGQAGIKVRLEEKGLEVDLTDGAVAEVLLAHLQPRFRAVLHGLETQ